MTLSLCDKPQSALRNINMAGIDSLLVVCGKEYALGAYLAYLVASFSSSFPLPELAVKVMALCPFPTAL